MTSGPSFSKDAGDRGDGIPFRVVTGPEEPVEGPEVSDDLEVAAVHADDEPVVPCDDLSSHLPLGGRLTASQVPSGGVGQDADETDNLGPHGFVREMIARHEPGDLATLDDHDFCVKGKS